MAMHFAEDVSDAVKLLSISPSFLKPLAAKKATVIEQRVRQCLDYLRADIMDRMSASDSDASEKPVSSL